MKIVTIVGARPQFIKVAAVSRILREKHEEILVHTGQHFDYNMSDVFFEELNIPKPNYNLGIFGSSHGKMTGEMLIEIEKVLIKELPEMVIVYGDTNSTLAGALASVKLHIPVCHIEAGGRLGTLENPEEINRVITDSISSILMCCTISAVKFLEKEGKTQNVYLVGDPMFDSFKYYSRNTLEKYNLEPIDTSTQQIEIPKNFYYLTCHREENTKDDETLCEIMSAMNGLELPTIYPVHPRNQKRAIRLKDKHNFSKIILCKPVGYLTSIYLVNNADKIVTDSGGLQREAFFAKKQCVTVFDYIAWPETMVGNCNQLAKPNKGDILNKLCNKIDKKAFCSQSFGDGNSAIKISDIISDYFKVK